MHNYIENNFARFIHILRHLGINVSIGETITAFTALSLVNIMNREDIWRALSATLVKNHDEQPIFKQAFESFFTVPEVRQQQRQEWEEKQAERICLIEEAEKDLAYQGDQLALTDEEKLLYAQLPEVKKQMIKDYLEKSCLPEDRNCYFKPMLKRQIRGSLHYWRQRLGEEDDFCRITNQIIDDEVLSSILQELSKDESNLLYEDMKKIGKQDLPQITNILRALSRKLATKISRRYRLSKKVVKIDLRRSIKANVRYGGIIFKLHYKQKRIQKPNIMLICDVSGSMARYAAFVIQFIYGLSSVVKNIESFIFAEELEYVTPLFKSIRPFEDTMVEIMEKSRIWGKGTNLNRSLFVLWRDYPLLLTSHTVMIILSDTKTLELEQAAQKLFQVKRNIKDIIWLNTLPQNEWKDLNSVVTFQRYCQMYECYTLAHLEKIIRKQFLD